MPAAFARDIDQPWCDLATLGETSARATRIAAAVLSHLLPALDDVRPRRPGTVPAALRRASTRWPAARSSLHQHDGKRNAVAEGLAPDGALRVRLDDGQRACGPLRRSQRADTRGMTQDWLFDFGNTRLKCAPLLRGRQRRARARARAVANSMRCRRANVAYLASVASEDARVQLLDALSRRFRRIALARTAATFGGLRIAYAQPAQARRRSFPRDGRRARRGGLR